MRVRERLEGEEVGLHGVHFFYDDFIGYLQADGWALDPLGTSSDGAYTIYGTSFGDPNKPTIYIQSSMHGSEGLASSYARQFLDYVTGRRDGGANNKELTQLRETFHWYWIPVLNPWGFDNRKRMNFNAERNEGVDINRNYPIYWDETVTGSQEDNRYKGPSPLSENETNISWGKVNELKPFMTLDNHRWSQGFNGLYCGDPSTKKYDELYLDAWHSITQSYGGSYVNTDPLWIRQQKYDRTSSFSPSVGTTISKEGTKVISFTTECNFPGSETKITMMSGINMMFHACLYAKKYFEKRHLIMR